MILGNLKQCQHERLLKILEDFEKYLIKMGNDFNIYVDVFLSGSNFMMWWEEWKEYKKNHSFEWSSSFPLYKKMENLEGHNLQTILNEKLVSNMIYFQLGCLLCS